MDDVRKTVSWLLDMMAKNPDARNFVEDKLVFMVEDSIGRADTTPMVPTDDGEWSKFSADKESFIAP